MFEQSSYDTPIEHICARAPDAATLYFSPQDLRAEADRFQRGFDGLVTYAVKANAAPEVLDNLVAAGIGAFDVASPEEIAQVRRAAARAVLHYNNPVRSGAEVAAGKAAGVRSWSVDDRRELEKLGTAAQGEEVAVRFKLPVTGAHYDFGEKFGATPSEAAALLQASVARGYGAALSFHPGTQCEDGGAWASYIRASAQIAREAGVTLSRLNVGGGFAAHRGAARQDLESVFALISREVRAAFGVQAPQLVCEPGRAMVADSFSLVTRVKALRGDGSLFLNDGIYGALAEWRDMTASTRVRFVRACDAQIAGPTHARRAFGPTCDSLDVLPEPLACPAGLREGDYVLFEGMGAYSLAIATRFNGYGPRDVITVKRAAFGKN